MIDVTAAMGFLETQGRPVELAWGQQIVGRSDADAVIAALASYQNPDGGFGRNLEVDISAPDSQPFATRLALLALVDLGVAPDAPMVQATAGWLEREQAEDGCWRFPPGVYDHPLAPWFAGWSFPSLNPALCLAGACHRLGTGSPRLFARVARLASSLATPEEAESGDFYAVLPYLEYYPWIDAPDRVAYLDALARGIAARTYETGWHFFEHAGPAAGDLAPRLPADLVTTQLDRLEREQSADGGWPTPYSPAWRPWVTAQALATLRSYGRL